MDLRIDKLVKNQILLTTITSNKNSQRSIAFRGWDGKLMWKDRFDNWATP